MNQRNFLIKDRRMMVLKRLLKSEHLSYQQLSEEYFVSRSSIAKDIAFIKEIFAKENLSLTFDNTGTYFEGSESQVQRVFKRTLLMLLEQNEDISILADPKLLKELDRIFRESLAEKKIEIPESYIQSIIVSILLIIERSQQSKDIDIEEDHQFGKFFLKFDKYPIIYELLKHIEERTIYRFTPKEIQYLTYLIVGSGLQFFMKRETIPFSFRGKVRYLIQKVSEGIQIDLTQDSRLEEDLVMHLYQLVLRIEAKTTIVNPLLDEIKQNYLSLYGVVWFSLNDFCKPYQLHLSDDEVGFVVIHFQAAVERIRKMNKILFVCPNGIGISSFISSKIRRILPEVDSIETASIDKLKEMDLSDIDFIISTVEIPITAKPVVKISPMVTIRDMKRIMNRYIDILVETDQKQEKTEIFQLNKRFKSLEIQFESFDTKRQVLQFLLEKQKFKSQTLKEQFIKSVYEREDLQTTYLENGFVIPHGNPEFVEESAISILVLDKPVEWGTQKADIIVLLMIREDDNQEVEPMMKFVMQGIENKDWFISKMLEMKK